MNLNPLGWMFVEQGPGLEDGGFSSARENTQSSSFQFRGGGFLEIELVTGEGEFCLQKSCFSGCLTIFMWGTLCPCEVEMDTVMAFQALKTIFLK